MNNQNSDHKICSKCGGGLARDNNIWYNCKQYCYKCYREVYHSDLQKKEEIQMNINIEANAQELFAMADYMRNLGRLNRAAELDKAAQELQAPPESDRVYFVTLEKEVIFGLDGEDIVCDFRAIWDVFGLELKVYDDCLFAMVDFADLWKSLARYDNQNITQKQFIKVLQNA